MDFWISWTVISSPNVFIISNTLVNFTVIDVSILVKVTIVVDVINIILSPTIFSRDSSVTVRIPLSHDFNGDCFDIGTSPRSWTFVGNVWTSTVNLFETWTVISDHLVVIINNTGVEFTSIGSTRTIIITIVVDVINVFLRPTIFSRDSSISVGVSFVHGVNSDLIDFITSPSTSTFSDSFEWTSTLSHWVTWTMFSSDLIFVGNDTFV